MGEDTIQYLQLKKILEDISKKHSKIILEDGVFYFRFGKLDLKTDTFIPEYRPTRDEKLLNIFGKREAPKASDVRDALLASRAISFTGIEKLFKLLEVYMEVTDKGPLSLGIDTNIILNGLINIIREKVRMSEWKGSLTVAIPTVVYQEVNRLLLEKYPNRITAPIKRRNLIEGLHSKMGRLAIVGLGNIQKLRQEIQVEMVGKPLSPHTFLSESGGKYYNDFIVREQIRDYAKESGKPTLHISADRDSAIMARAEGLPTILIELPLYPVDPVKVKYTSDFLYSLSLIRGILELKDEESGKKVLELRSIWPGKRDYQFFEHYVQVITYE
ncbi:MAG: hypothetical protein ACP6IS_00210 [Candidatus Asgardarchaeia archaeon]